MDVFSDFVVFGQFIAIVTTSIPVRIPSSDDSKSIADRVSFFVPY